MYILLGNSQSRDSMIKYKIVKSRYQKLWKKKYFWIVYSETDGVYNSGYCWTKNSSKNDAQLYIDKINDGRFIK